MSNGLLLWIDDEIELLKAHIIFLEKKGYEVQTVSNGPDAIELCRQQTFDLILLDEMMPGLSGLETLIRIKDIQPATPVVMCTKSEEENIMDQAIGQDSRLSDKTRKPEPDSAVAQEEHPPQRHRGRGYAERIPAGLPADSHADDGMQNGGRLDGDLQATGKLGTEVERYG